MRTLGLGVAGGVLGAVLLIAGCGTPRQTVNVSERPAATADTGTNSVDSLSNTVSIPSGYDTVQVGQFDRGKLWPFDQLPTDFFRSAYGLEVTEEWRTKARRAALRFGENCSASFVSSKGLVMTNHHCARDAIAKVSRRQESLLKNGFYADSLGQERQVPGLYVEELVRIQDVTSRVRKDEDRRTTRGQPPQQRVDRIEDVMTREAKKEIGEASRVDIVSLYGGHTYAAYTYRRHENVRMVMVPELEAGYFGQETDNFTYPRFTFDVAFFRVYTADGTPMNPRYHFSWDLEGVEAGEPVFAVGNPGSTSRHRTVSQLEYERDYRLPGKLEALRKRRDLLQAFIANNPEDAENADLQNTLFKVENSVKSVNGKLEGLKDPYLLARRGKALQALKDSVARVDSLSRVPRAIGEIKRLQESKRILADKENAFFTLGNVELGSRILTRAVHGYYYEFLRKRGARPDRIESIRSDAESVKDWPADLERSFIVTQLKEVQAAYGSDHPTMQRLFRKRSPEELAAHLVEESVLMDSTDFVNLLDTGYLKSEDPSVSVVKALAPLFLNVSRQMDGIRRTEETLNGRLSKASRALYGKRIPPDATFTLRLSDGVVKGYDREGTEAPPFTTFSGMYDRHHARTGDDWTLPGRWSPPPDSFDLETPLNLVSTNDISGGSSGSALLNKDLELVGVVFDSNMEALPNEYLYRTRGARAISVDVRGIVEALRTVYEADRLIQEIDPATEDRGTKTAEEEVR